MNRSTESFAQLEFALLSKNWDATLKLVGVLVTPVLGVFLGLTTPTDHLLPSPWNRISSVIGWMYFSAWSVSFYPQVYLNWQRKSVVGLSFDFVLYNLLGFMCYAAYTTAFYWSPVAQQQYADAHNNQHNSVQANDVFFALHAAVLVLVTALQVVWYERGSQRVSTWCWRICTLLISGVVVFGVAEALWPDVLGWQLTLLDFMYLLSYVKLLMTFFKYVPQVLLNHKRKSTEGWNVWNVLLDIAGGVLSLLQLFLDAVLTSDWTVVTGNPVKLGLSLVSLGFDSVFIVQHYWLYPELQDVPRHKYQRAPSASPSDGDVDVEAAGKRT